MGISEVGRREVEEIMEMTEDSGTSVVEEVDLVAINPEETGSLEHVSNANKWGIVLTNAQIRG